MSEEKIIKNENVDSSSLEFGSPTKTGRVKIYGNFNKEEDFKKKVDSAISCMLYAQTELEKKMVNK